jgi:hypothetical protein
MEAVKLLSWIYLLKNNPSLCTAALKITQLYFTFVQGNDLFAKA